jgi:acyl-CoA thioesterase I
MLKYVMAHQSGFLTTHLFVTFLSLSLAIAGCQSATVRDQEQTRKTEAETPNPLPEKKTIVFFGNSLTTGYGLEESESFPSIIQDKIDSLNLPYRVVNAGVSGETSAGGLSRIDWILKQPVDIFILELGGNDALRGFDLSATRSNLTNIIDRVRAKDTGIKIIVAGMKAPPNMGQKYSADFENIFRELSDKKNTLLIPFLLEGVAGNPDLNLADNIHPNPKGQIIVAENVWNVLKDVLEHNHKSSE